MTSETTTLVARWTSSYYYEGNEVLMAMPADASKYSKPDGVNFQYKIDLDSDRTTSINQGLYPSTEGAQGFWKGDDDTVSAGIGLPAFDFSKVNGVHFTFGFSAGVWTDNIYVNGTAVGSSGDAHHNCNYIVNIIGKNVSVYNQDKATTYTSTLDDDTYNGKKGLEIKTEKNWGAYLFVTQYVSLDCDYFSAAKSVEASLPDTPAAGYGDKVKEYQTLRDFFTEYEKSAYPVSEKVQSWIDAYSLTKVYAFDDHGDNVYSTLTGNSSFVASSYVYSYDSNGWKDTSRTDSLQWQVLGLDDTYFTLTLPKFDFSSYGNVSFTMEVGGGPGDKTFKYWLGAIDDTPNTTDQKAPSSLTSLSNYVGAAPTGSASKWDTGGTTVSIADGKIIFSGLSSSSEDKTFDLDESIYKGTKGLSITVGWGSWNCFAISPFYASKF